jgi:AcrR family transcriptional regulator
MDPRVIRSRTAVIAATLDLLAERGITATTIEATGVAKTTIYCQWGGQPELVLDAIGTTGRTPTDPDTGTLRGDLLDLLGGLADTLNTSPAAGLTPALIDAAERDPALAALHHREAAQRHQVVLTAIVRRIDRGELTPDTDPAEGPGHGGLRPADRRPGPCRLRQRPDPAGHLSPGMEPLRACSGLWALVLAGGQVCRSTLDRHQRAGRRHAGFTGGSPAVSHTKSVASYRPRSLGTEMVDICGGAVAWAARARQAHRAGAIVPPRMSC